MKKVIVFVLVMIVIMLLCSTVALAADGIEDDAVGGWLMSYIVKGAYILIPALYVIGLVIKKIPKIPDWTIPIVLLVLGVVFAMAIMGWGINGALQGVLVAGAAVLLNQLYKQVFIKSKE